VRCTAAFSVENRSGFVTWPKITPVSTTGSAESGAVRGATSSRTTLFRRSLGEPDSDVAALGASRRAGVLAGALSVAGS